MKIELKDIAIVEYLHDLLLEKYGHDFNSAELELSRKFAKRMYDDYNKKEIKKPQLKDRTQKHYLG